MLGVREYLIEGPVLKLSLKDNQGLQAGVQGRCSKQSGSVCKGTDMDRDRQA